MKKAKKKRLKYYYLFISKGFVKIRFYQHIIPKTAWKLIVSVVNKEIKDFDETDYVIVKKNHVFLRQGFDPKAVYSEKLGIIRFWYYV